MKSIAERSNVSASVILNHKGEPVATVQTLYGSGGTVYVEVHAIGDAALLRCLDTSLKTGRVTQKQLDKAIAAATYCSTPESKRHYAADELLRVQRSSAGGYGYDKATAALAGMVIDGHTMANHCGNAPEAEKARARLFREYCAAHDKPEGEPRTYEYWRDRAKRIGARFSNYCQAGNKDRGKNAPPLRDRATSLYFESGLERLSSLGYRIISAV